jgi:5-formyltetrahydrofolate cyclo-ligase
MNEEQVKYWEDFCKSIGINAESAYVEASVAGNETNAEELLLLYLQGKKTAGSGLVRDYENAGDDLPKIGNYWVILDLKEKPRCIVKTVKVVTHAFKDVPSEIAKAEGEGDLSIEFWRNGHKEFFTPYLAELGIEDLDTAEVVTEFYEVVFK